MNAHHAPRSVRLPIAVSIVLLVASAIGVLAGLLVVQKSDALAGEPSSESHPSSPLQSTLAPLASPVVAVSPNAHTRAPSTDPDATLPFDAPSASSYRDEVRRSPHDTPASLVRFGSEFARRSALAEADPARRQDLFDDLERCTIDSSQQLPRSVRSFCFLRLRMLASSDPSRFETSFESVEARIPDALALRSSHRGFP